jgi:glucose-1-phosphate adenylyltransferase
MLEIHFLGDFRLLYNGQPVTTIATNRLQSLLAYLVLHSTLPQPRQRVASLLWPDSSESQARTNLRNLVFLLRQALPGSDDYLCLDGSSMQWRPDSDYTLDVAELEKASANRAYETVVTSYLGDLLPDCYDEWMVDKREQLRQAYAGALASLIQQKERDHDYRSAIEYAQRLIRHEPLQEQSYRECMRLYALSGDRAGIVRTYRECSRVLQNELGIEPSVGTRETYLSCQKSLSESKTPASISTEVSGPSAREETLQNSPHRTLALMLAGGKGAAFRILTDEVVKPELPIAGMYRVIDISLSNLINSGLDRIAVLTQHQPREMIRHLTDRRSRGPARQPLPGIQIWEPSLERTGTSAYSATGDAVHQNRDFIRNENCDTLLVVSADHVYRQDYRDLLRFHHEKGADLTIVVRPVPQEQAHRFGIVTVDENQRIVDFVEKPVEYRGSLASLGVYVFNAAFLLAHLERDARDASSQHDFGRNIIPSLIGSSRVFAYQYNGYWMDIDTPETYWRTSLALLDQEPGLNLHDPAWLFHSSSNNPSLVDIRPTGRIVDSLVAEGCIIEGDVTHSILSPGVQVKKGAVVHDSVIFQNAVIENGATVQACLVGDQVQIGPNTRIGTGDDLTPNLDAGLTLGMTILGKGSHVPANATIGHNCCVSEYFTYHAETLFHLPSGRSIQ